MSNYITSLPSTVWQNTWPRQVAVLGSTGSIGCSALAFLRLHPQRFQVAALAGARNIALLATQAAEFRPPVLAVLEETAVPALRALLPAGYSPEIYVGQEGYEAVAALKNAQVVLSAQVGAAGLRGTWAAVQAGKVVALANKESLVLAGGLMRAAAARSKAVMLPVDSEHNALFQCLCGHAPESVRGLILTASGGPFREFTPAALAQVTPAQALKHPNWSMGAKISIDSATLMNKGLELIEAHHLFGVALEHIDVVVHTESIVHSLVEFHDGSQLAQLGTPDMRTAIAYALAYPLRLDTGVPRLTLPQCGSLHFTPPREEAFPCLGLARQALMAGAEACVALNAANEVAVEAFLQKRLSFPGIAAVVAETLNALPRFAPQGSAQSIDDVLSLDAVCRTAAAKAVGTA